MNDDEQHRKLYQQINVLTAGEPMEVAGSVFMELICTCLCAGHDNKAGALVAVDQVRDELREMIEERYDHYHAQAVEVPDEPHGRS